MSAERTAPVAHEVDAFGYHLAYELSGSTLGYKCSKSKIELRIGLGDGVRSLKPGYHREKAFYIGWLLLAFGILPHPEIFNLSTSDLTSASFWAGQSFTIIGFILVVAAHKRYRVHRLRTHAGDLLLIVHDSKRPDSGHRLITAVRDVIAKHKPVALL